MVNDPNLKEAYRRKPLIKYVVAESNRWLLHRRRNTKTINITGYRRKQENKEKKRGGKQGTKASKKMVLKASP